MSSRSRFGVVLIFGMGVAAHPALASLHVSFDELPLPEVRLYWNGSDGSGGFTSKGAFFTNCYNSAWGGSWTGFTYSKVNDTNTPGYGNEYAVACGTGYGGAGNFAVAYDDGLGSAVVALPYPTEVRGARVCNTTYAALDMRDGSFFSKKFGGASGNDPDWFLLTVTARDTNGAVLGTNAFYLADFRFETNSLDYIVTDWTWLSLTNLGDTVKSLQFSLSSSDTGAWGMNTPAFFALDDLQFKGVFSLGLGDGDNPHDPGVPAFVGPAGDGVTSSSNRLNPVFYGWAVSYTNFLPAPGGEERTNAALALGPATGDHFTDVVSLGDLTSEQIASNMQPGEITLSFGRSIKDHPGPDLAIFENAFGWSNSLFAELAYVEVSSDGTNFARFPAESATPLPSEETRGYFLQDPRGLFNLAGKHVNSGKSDISDGDSWGTPFDLADLVSDPMVRDGRTALDNIRYVKIVDIPGSGDFKDSEGNPIYDSWVTFGKGGFDLEAAGIIRPAVRIKTAASRVVEGGSGAVVTVSRDAYFARFPLSVDLQIGGSASNSLDYGFVTNTVRFAAGEINHAMRIDAVADGVEENEETATIALATNETYSVDGTGSVTVTLADYFYGSNAWTRFRLPDRSASLVNYGTALAHLPDGRCVFGEMGSLHLQEQWDGSNWLAYAQEPATNDPSFIAVWDDTTAALGAGRWKVASAIYGFTPSDTNTPFVSRCTNYNYAAVFRDVGSLYVVGGDYGESKVRLISLDGQTNKVLVDSVSTDGAGTALGAHGELYVGDADDGKVWRFSRAQLDAAATNGPLSLSDGEFVHQFVYNGATNVLGSLAVDGRGCVWGAGQNVNGVQVFDPVLGQTARYAPALDNGNYTVAGFTRNGRRYVGYVNLASHDAGAAQYYGYVLADGEREIAIEAAPDAAGEWGPTDGAVRVTRRSWNAELPVTADLEVTGTASNGVDYAFVTNTLTLAAGTHRSELAITPLPDSLAEGAETVAVRLAASTNYSIAGSGEATVRIEDLPVDAWRLQHFGAQANSAEAGDAGDWNADGVPNLLDYALNRDPVGANSSPAMEPQRVPTNQAPSGFCVIYTRRKSLPDASVGAQSVSNLVSGAWTASNVVEQVMAEDADTETIRATLTGTPPAGFVRLRAARK